MKIALSAALAAAMSFSAQAGTLSDLSKWNGVDSIQPFGGQNGGTGVYGETFIAPTHVLNGFTFEVNDGNTELDDVYAEVFAWSGSLTGNAGPQGATGPALFTSSPFTISASSSFQAVSINTGNTVLTPGGHYVILFVDTGPDAAVASFGAVLGGSGLANDGGMNFFNNDHTLGTVNTEVWDDFANLGSLAFSATFTPEPSAWALMIAGVGGVGLALRRRRERATA